MSLDDRVRQAFEPLADQLRNDLSGRISATVDKLKAELEAEQASAVSAAVEATTRQVTGQLTTQFEGQRDRAIAEAVARVERDVAARLEAKFEAECAQALADAARDATAAAERAVTERLSAEFEAERVAAVAQAASDAAAAAENATVARLTRQFDAERSNAVAQVARETSESVERLVTERLTADHQAERARAVSEAIAEATARVQRETAERLSSHHEMERTDAVSRATEETWAKAEQARTNAEAVERYASRRLVDAIRALDECQTLSEVLHALSNAARAEAARTSLLLVDAEGFRGSRSHGFGDEAGIGVLRVTHEDAGIIGEAARTARVASIAGDTSHADSPRDGSPGGAEMRPSNAPPRFAGTLGEGGAVAVPLILTGRVVGVLYADLGTDGSARRPTWQAALDILGRHASRVLEAITAAKLAEAATGRPMKAPLTESEASRTHTAQAGSWN